MISEVITTLPETDRSMPPVISTNVMPMPTTPLSAEDTRMFLMFIPVMNKPPVVMEKITQINTISNASTPVERKRLRLLLTFIDGLLSWLLSQYDTGR